MPRSSLAIGVLAPNRNAEPSASIGPLWVRRLCGRLLIVVVALDIGPLGLKAGGGFLHGKSLDRDVCGAAAHFQSRATRTEQRAWRTTRAALVPSR